MELAVWIYLSVGLGGLLLALLSFVMGSISHLDFLHHDFSMDTSHDFPSHDVGLHPDHTIGFSKFLNTGGILGGISGFGFSAAFTMAAFETTYLQAAGYGVIGGLVLGGLLGGFWYLLRRSEGSIGYNLASLVGKEGRVQEKIYKDGVGQIVCLIQGRNVWYSARTETGEEAPVGQVVVIKSIAGSTLQVVKKEV